MCANDEWGYYVIEACRLGNINVPDDVMVLGSDNDIFLCETIHPQLSSIARNIEKAGYRAAELLDYMFQGKKIKESIYIEPIRIVTRASTDMLLIEDDEIVSALRYIRENIKNKISVSDIVDATNLSRRPLELRFKKRLKITIAEELRKIRADTIASLLVDTDLTVSQIALTVKFIDIQHISSFFKKVKGMTPKEYRENVDFLRNSVTI